MAVTPNGRADAVCNVATGSLDQQEQSHFVLPLERQMPMTDFLQHLKHQQFSTCRHDPKYKSKQAADASSDARNASCQEVMYIQQQNGNFTSHFPELAQDVDNELTWASEAFGAQPDAVNLWIGNDQSVTSFHKDHYENLYAVVTGEKTFTLLPPCDAYRMHLAHYPMASCMNTPEGLQMQPSGDDQQVLWSPIEDLSGAPCSTEHQHDFPAYFDPSLPRPYRVTVKAGEVLYLPSLWWHQVEQTAGKDNMVMAVNYWYDMPFDCKYAYYKLVEALAGPVASARELSETFNTPLSRTCDESGSNGF